jgi:Tfp pilus assembly protein PilO
MSRQSIKFKLLQIDRSTVFRAHLLLAVFVFFVLGLWGVRTGLNTLEERNARIESLQRTESDLRNKSVELIKAAETLEEVSDKLPDFYLAMPDDVDMINYLPLFSLLAAQNGFAVRSFNPYLSGNDSTDIDVELLGSPEYLSEFITRLESVHRLTTVNSAKLTFVRNRPRFLMQITVYHSNYETLDFTQAFNDTIDIEFLERNFEPAYE